MLFNSIEYLFFLPLVFLLYWLVCRNNRSRNLLIVAASFVFYGWWDWRFLCLMVVSCLCSFFAGLLLENSRKRRGLILATSLVINLGILFVFKYFNFFVESMEEVMHILGVNASPQFISVVLPVGISFYTFQAVGYTLDVYRRGFHAVKDPILFFAFISFFPQLVAGPIERASNLIPQFMATRSFKRSQAVDGMRQILWGLMKKMLLADNCAVVANYVFANYATLSAADLWVGAVCFTFQIYGDFSGYSDIAIGSGKLFGIRLMQNFRLPYFSQTIPEFWRRWHISLMTWLRDYVYFPLGGSRCSSLKHVRNVAVVFFISGLWHGANWTFVAWGLYHAALFLPFSLVKGKQTRGSRFLLTIATFVLVVVGWVIFRSATLTDAWQYIVGMFDVRNLGTVNCGRQPLIYIVGFTFVEYLCRKREYPLAFAERGLLKYRTCRFAVYLALFLLTLVWGGVQMPFIYFQF
jgi:alginate O-acetyltransferase complex protein AlgI